MIKLTLALPALEFPNTAALPPLEVPALNQLLRFGTFEIKPQLRSAFYGDYLWQGSLLAHAKAAIGVAATQPAVLVSPVWQQIGMHHMNMLGGQDIQITTAEAQQFCQGLSEFYAEEGWRFVMVRADLWLAMLPETPQWQAAPVWDVLGQVDGTMRAEGADSNAWLQKQTEIQMWLHGHALNAERVAAGLPAVNGVWLWRDAAGAAEREVLGSDSAAAQFYPGRRLDQGYDFAAWREILREQGCDGVDSVLFIEDLALAHHTSDAWAYQRTLMQLEERWFVPVWQALQSGDLKTFVLASDGNHGGAWKLGAKPQWRFWKKRRLFSGSF